MALYSEQFLDLIKEKLGPAQISLEAKLQGHGVTDTRICDTITSVGILYRYLTAAREFQGVLPIDTILGQHPEDSKPVFRFFLDNMAMPSAIVPEDSLPMPSLVGLMAQQLQIPEDSTESFRILDGAMNL